MPHPSTTPSADDDVTLRLGHDEIVLSQRYEVASIANDILIAVWFVVGSILFFSDATATTGTWLFLIGSVQMMIRPAIRLARRVHLRTVGGGRPHGMDF